MRTELERLAAWDNLRHPTDLRDELAAVTKERDDLRTQAVVALTAMEDVCSERDRLRAMLERVRDERDAACVELVRERGDAVAWLREVSERRFPRNEREQGIVFRLAHEFERGEHRRNVEER